MQKITVTYGRGFAPVPARTMHDQVRRLQEELSKLPQYQPETKHRFHGGMYCRDVWRPSGVLVVGKVHRKEHFYLIVSGTVCITTDSGVQCITGPAMIESMPGTKRAVYAKTDALCMTFHRTDATDVEAAEAELVEDEPTAMYAAGNLIKNTTQGVLS